MKVKTRSYNLRLIRQQHSYLVQEVAELFGLHKNSVLNWLKQGLKTIDRHAPYLIHGSDLHAFLHARQKGRKQPCQPGELFCCKCRQPRPVENGRVTLTQLMRGDWLVQGICAQCGTLTRRFCPTKNLPHMRNQFVIETSAEEHLVGRSTHLVNCVSEAGTTP